MRPSVRADLPKLAPSASSERWLTMNRASFSPGGRAPMPPSRAAPEDPSLQQDEQDHYQEGQKEEGDYAEG